MEDISYNKSSVNWMQEAYTIRLFFSFLQNMACIYVFTVNLLYLFVIIVDEIKVKSSLSTTNSFPTSLYPQIRDSCGVYSETITFRIIVENEVNYRWKRTNRAIDGEKKKRQRTLLLTKTKHRFWFRNNLTLIEHGIKQISHHHD